jgi:tetratricopeptide (TPR) repeat protein
LFGFLIPLGIVQVPREVGRWHLASAFQQRLKGESETAYSELELAMRWFPNSPELLLQRGKWKLKDGKKDEGLADADRAVEVSQDDSLVRNARGEMLLTAGEFTRAIDDLKEVKEFSRRSGSPPLDNALNQLAYARALLKVDLDEAFRDVSEALEIISDNSDVVGSRQYASKIAYLDTRGYISFQRGENDSALDDLNEAVKRIESSDTSGATKEFVAPAIKSLLATQDDNARDRGIATIYYHRLLVLDALGRKEEADKDREKVRGLIGQEPDETLF